MPAMTRINEDERREMGSGRDVLPGQMALLG